MSLRRMVLLSALAFGTPTVAFAASDVSNSGSQAVTATATVAASVAATQTATIISGAATGGFTAGGVGGFSAGGTGGFSGGSTGGSGGFSGGSTGGSGGFGTGGGNGSGGSSGGGTGGSGGNGNGNEGGNGNGGFNGGGNNPSKPQSYNLQDDDQKVAQGTFNTRLTGHNAGDPGNATGVWGQGLYAHIDKSEPGLQMKGNVYNAALGVDRRFHEKYLAGVALAYENVDIDTSFNSGTYKDTGLSLMPYGAITLTPAWTLDASFGYTWLNYDTTRQNGAVTGSFDGHRWSYSGNLTGGYAYDNWRFQPKVGLLYTTETHDSYLESGGSSVGASSTSLGRLSGGGKVGYAIGDFLPYVKAIGEWDFEHPGAVQKSNGQWSIVDDHGGVAGLGFEYTSRGSTASLEVDNTSVLRRDTDVWAIIGRVRYEW